MNSPILLPEFSESTLVEQARAARAEADALLENLTATQARCGELLEEARAARSKAAAYRLAAESLTESLHDLSVLVERQREEIEGLRLRLANAEPAPTLETAPAVPS